MLELKVKDIREALEETLTKFYALADFSVGSTKVANKDKEFRIEFRIYDTAFWMEVDPTIDSVRICTNSLGTSGALDSIQIWLSKPFDFDKSKFKFGWRKDLEIFFDAFHATLLEKVNKNQKTAAAAVYGSSTQATETEEGKVGASVIAAILNGLDTKKDETKDSNKPSIFNSLKDGEDEYI